MNPERFRQIRNLFDAAVERPTEARPAFIDEACQGDEDLREAVSRLLSAHQETKDGVLRPPALLQGDAGRMEGRRIGNYEILRELGRGGMGSVYLAARTDQVYRKAVALKVVRAEASSEDVRRRFHQEREILASLDHPNIARLLDGGATPEGLPYFVMEFVDGQAINAYCDERQLNVAARLKLFRAVCAAVDYAHGRGVAHRDLKPANILVTAEGVVKLLDFGIAKLLGDEADGAANLTRTGLRPMTPEYASPEQVKGDNVGKASDQYSLGVVLYELLTGHRPYRMRSRLIHEVVRVICEESPTLPSAAVAVTAERLTPQLISRSRETTPAELRRELSGDIDNILLRTLQKDPHERYASVKDLSEDLQRRLNGEAVTARPQGLLYRAGRFLTQHKEWAIAAAVLILGLATGMVKINGLAVVTILFFLGCLTATFAVVAFEAGTDFAKSHLFSWVVVLLGIFGFAMAVLGSTYVTARLDALPVDLIPLVILPPAMLCALVLLFRWPWRNKWAGSLVLDLNPEYRRLQRGLLAGSTAALGVAAVAVGVAKSPVEFITVLAAVLAISFAACFWGSIEVRARGILYFGVLTRWRKIESFGWERSEGSRAILRVRFKKKGWESWWIVLPAERRAETDAILRKQLSEWPGGTVSPAGTTVTE